MISALNSSVSGIQAALKLQSVSANNIANSCTDGFKSDLPVVEEADTGVKVSLSKSAEQGLVHDRGDGVEVEASNVDIAGEMTGQINSKSLLKANTAAIKTTNEILGSLLDILA